MAENPGAESIAAQTADDLGDPLARPVSSGSSPAGPGDVSLLLDADRNDLGTEAYQILVTDKISITASTEQGLFYGTRTVVQWATLAKPGGVVPGGSAIDSPQYPERGVGVCACQIQVSVEYLERLIKEMSYYKLNQLWIETKIASDAYPAANFWAYFTKEQARALSDFAKRYFVELVVEVNSPGHMSPWLYEYPELQLTDKNGVKQPDRLDITKPEAFAFVTTLIDEYRAVIDTPYWHMGADEYMLGSAYDAYPQMAAYARDKFGPDAQPIDAFIDFINRVNEYVKSKGMQLRIWNDGIPVTPGIVQPSNDIVIEHWLGDNSQSPTNLLAAGFDVQNANYNLYYIRGGLTPQLENLWNQNWTPLNFHGSVVSANAGPGQVTGAKITVWPGSTARTTEQQMEATMHPGVRFLAQSTWGSPRPTPDYQTFNALGSKLGNGPNWQNTSLPVPSGSYQLAVADQTLASSQKTVALANGSSARWTLTQTSDGYYTIKSSSNTCLDIVGAGTKLWLNVPTSSGIAPELTNCSGTRSLQKWWFKAVPGGYQLINAITQMPLSATGQQLSQEAPDQKAAAVFSINL